MNDDSLEEHIHKAVIKLNEADPYHWADVIYTLVQCKRELDAWQQSAINSGSNDWRPKLDIWADQ